MTIKGHVDAISELVRNLDTHWADTGWKAKVVWLSMIQKLAKALEAVAQSEGVLDE